MTALPTRLLALGVPLALLAACASEPPAPAPATPVPLPAPAPLPAPVTAPPAAAPAPAVTVPPPKQRFIRLTLREAQQRLLDKGYDPGTIDGLYGPLTIEALRQFQRQQKLLPTGRLDSETMNRLAQ